ncbi:MAG TPA: efflux RND transporter periplasmic adaptor subunit [Rhodocyclaceae bacterium]|nr:efflux RND transporter periplasmic adaptor subunit [Rhodocyclaceae bacterium]
MIKVNIVAGAVLLQAGFVGAQNIPPPASASVAVSPAPTLSKEATAEKDGRIRVQISAQQQTVLSAEIAAKLISLPLKEGDSFHAGQALASFDCAIYRAQLGKVEATAEAARQTLKVNRRLAELNSISTLEVDQSAAKLKETEAESSAVRVTLSKCTVSAPFSGRVAKVHAEPHQFVAQGKPLLDIVDNKRLEVRLIAPSKWLAWLTKGTRFTVHVEELNRSFPANVTRLGARIDPVNQSVSLVGEMIGRADNLLPGMSGWATFTHPAAK